MLIEILFDFFFQRSHYIFCYDRMLLILHSADTFSLFNSRKAGFSQTRVCHALGWPLEGAHIPHNAPVDRWGVMMEQYKQEIR